MDPINGLNNIMEILRRQIADNAKRLDHPGKTSRLGASQTGQKSGKTSPGELRALIHDRIKSLDPQETQYQHKAKRLFLESVMAWEFGNDIVRDQEFSDMIADIQETLETTPEIKRQFDGLIEQLTVR
jgi:hypothetical protein